MEENSTLPAAARHLMVSHGPVKRTVEAWRLALPRATFTQTTLLSKRPSDVVGYRNDLIDSACCVHRFWSPVSPFALLAPFTRQVNHQTSQTPIHRAEADEGNMSGRRLQSTTTQVCMLRQGGSCILARGSGRQHVVIDHPQDVVLRTIQPWVFMVRTSPRSRITDSPSTYALRFRSCRVAVALWFFGQKD